MTQLQLLINELNQLLLQSNELFFQEREIEKQRRNNHRAMLDVLKKFNYQLGGDTR